MTAFYNNMYRCLFLLLVVFTNYCSVQAQFLLDTVILEKPQQRALSMPDVWKRTFVSDIDISQYLLLSGLSIGQETGEFQWDKAEKALRASGLFHSVHLEIDTIDSRHGAVFIVSDNALPKEGPGLTIMSGGTQTSLGCTFASKQLVGNPIELLFDMRYRSELEIGPQFTLNAVWNNAFSAQYSLGAGIVSHQFTTQYHAFATKQAHPLGGLMYGAGYSASNGKDFLFDMAKTLMISHKTSSTFGWMGWLIPRKDNLYITLKAGYNAAERGSIRTVQAFDNTMSVLLGFGSLADRTRLVQGEDIPIGAWGSAVLGRITPINDRGGESYYYVGGTVEQSALSADDAVYAYARLSAGSGIIQGSVLNTAMEIATQMQYKAMKNMVISAHADISSAWNWADFRQLVLDNDAGLRGFIINGRTGNNRMISSVDMRTDIMPLMFGTRLGITTFVDAGTVWNAGETLANTQWNASIGGGIVILAEGRSLQTGHPLLRLEYAQGLQMGRGSGIIISTNYAFSLVQNHSYQQPNVIGADIDTE